MSNNTLQARQRQSQLFQQQENARRLYTINWAAEIASSDFVDKSEWTAENNVTFEPAFNVAENTGSQIVTTITPFGFPRDTEYRFGVASTEDLELGAYVYFENLTGDAEALDAFSSGYFEIIEINEDILFFQIANDEAVSTGVINTGDVGRYFVKNTQVYVSGTPGNYVLTNKITTTSGEILERQLIIKILDNDSNIISDYC